VDISTRKKLAGLTMMFVVGITALCSGTPSANAQEFKPPVTRNSALRYWIAFSLMQDPPANKETAELLNQVASGKAEWNEEKLGPIIDANRTAILTMQRATRLPECDWGVEMELGPAAPIPPYAKARVLGNLNVLYGMREAAHHDMKGAAETWLAGVRFAEQMPHGMSLIGTVVGQTVLLANLRALDAEAVRGGLDENLRAQVAKAVRAVPEYGFDWSEGWRFETYVMELAMKKMREAPDPKEWYTEASGQAPPSPFVLPTTTELREFQQLMDEVAEAYSLPYPAAKEKLAGIEPQIARLNPAITWIIPNPSRSNERRAEVQAERGKLLEDLAKVSAKAS
jgi:hypothetical protein